VNDPLKYSLIVTSQMRFNLFNFQSATAINVQTFLSFPYVDAAVNAGDHEKESNE